MWFVRWKCCESSRNFKWRARKVSKPLHDFAKAIRSYTEIHIYLSAVWNAKVSRGLLKLKWHVRKFLKVVGLCLIILKTVCSKLTIKTEKSRCDIGEDCPESSFLKISKFLDLNTLKWPNPVCQHFSVVLKNLKIRCFLF